MGLFDELGQVAGMLGQGGQGQGGQGQDGQYQGEDGQAQGQAPQGAIGAVLQMIQSQPGGISGVVQQFEQGGLGGVAQSWLSNSQNHPVSPDQVQNTLGDGAVGQVASQLGVSNGEAAGHIAQFLPQIMDHLSPNGQAPEGGGLQQIEGLLGQFMNRGGQSQA